MYKVFFENRIVFITDDFASAFKYNYGLFYKFYDKHELAELVKLFGYLTKIKKLFIVHKNKDHLFRQFSSLFTFIEAAGGVVRSASGKVLVINRRGKWDLPKGKVDAGETTGETALREVGEETGLKDLSLGKKITDTFHTYLLNGKPVLKKTSWYEMAYGGEEGMVQPQREEEITEVLWLLPDDVTMILGNTYLSIIDVLREADLLPF
jgi:8-oxo-dGTP pyrophosphatase MutT (NUDIX family)